MKSHKIFGDYNSFKDKDNDQRPDTFRSNNRRTAVNNQRQHQYNSTIDTRSNDMQSIRMRSVMGEAGKALIHQALSGQNTQDNIKPSWAKNALSVGSSINAGQYSTNQPTLSRNPGLGQ